LLFSFILIGYKNSEKTMPCKALNGLFLISLNKEEGTSVRQENYLKVS